MPIVLNGTTGITTPTYNGSTAAEYLVPVTAFKNRIINGAMVIDQRNAGASVTPTDGQYTLDRWFASLSQASKFTIQQNAGSVTPPTGYTNYLGLTVGASANVTVGTSDYFLIGQYIEGLNVADLGFGAAGASTVTLSFWVRSSLTGTFGGALRNSAANRSYPFTYSISSANTWEQKSITVTGDTSGTWLKTNGIGLAVLLTIGSGSTYSDTAGAWTSKASVISATGATNLISTNSATFYITGVQLEVGSTATSFDYRPYGTELQLCQRYYQFVGGAGGNGFPLFQGYTTIANNIDTPISFPVSMRTTPTTSVTGTWAVDNTVQPTIIFPNTQGFSMRITATATGRLFAYPDSANTKMTFSAEL